MKRALEKPVGVNQERDHRFMFRGADRPDANSKSIVAIAAERGRPGVGSGVGMGRGR